MKNVTLLIIFTFALSTLAFGAKKYNLTIKVFSLYTRLPLEGIKVSTIIDNTTKEIGYTNANGEIILKELTEKSFGLLYEDTKGIHKMKKFNYSNSNRKDDLKVYQLKLTTDEELKLFKAIDEQYKDTIENKSTDKMDTALVKSASPKDNVEFYTFIHSQIEYPQECLDKAIQGKVYLKFIVQKDGKITHVEVLKGIHPLLDYEAIRVLRYAPNWNPSTYDGTPIQTFFTLPVNFRIN